MAEKVRAWELLRCARAMYDAPSCPLGSLAGSAWRGGFTSAGRWMQHAQSHLRNLPPTSPIGGLNALGAVKYGLAGAAALLVALTAVLLKVWPLLLVCTPAFYAVEAQMVFLFPLVLDGSNVPGIVFTLDTSNVTQSAADSITVSSAIVNNTTTNTLTLDAPTVTINANIALPNGGLTFGAFGSSGTTLSSASGATISANLVGVRTGYTTVNFAGAIQAPVNGFSYNPTAGSPASFSATNASNQIKNLYLSGAGVFMTRE